MDTIAAIQDTGAQTSLQPLNHLHLVAAQVLLERVWPDHRARPCVRWLWEQQRVRAIPSTRVGRRVCKRRLKSAAGGARKVPHLPSKGNWIFRSPSSC